MSSPIIGPLAPAGRPSDTVAADEKRASFREMIILWVGNLRLSEAMKREELAQLEGLQRHLALSKNLIPTVIRICRLHPRADAKTPLMVLISLLCDNNNGLCRLTIKRMAQLLNRTERSIRETIDQLERDGLLFVNRLDGLPNSYWPAVAPVLAEANAAVTWFVDALSDKPKAWGRPATHFPKENPGTSVPPFSENPGTSVPKPRNERAQTPERAAHSISLLNPPSGSEASSGSNLDHPSKGDFVISAEHGLAIPAKTVEQWRKRFPAIPDLEAKMQKLATVIVHKGPMHPGWTQPAGWMVGCLSDDNQRAGNEAKIANAKIASHQRHQPVRTFQR